MIIDLSRILNGKESIIPLEFELPFKDEKILKNYNIVQASNLNIAGQVTYMDGGLFVKCTYTTNLQLKCDRCLKPFEYTLEGDIFKGIKPETQSDMESEEDDVYYYEGQDLDISPIVMDDILFNIPLQMVCDSDCQGLCPTCGVDLNEKDCECNKEKIDPRFEVLKSFFDKEEV